MTDKNYYQCCAVPCCGNTTIKTPAKLFIHVPFATKIRKKWFALARKPYEDLSSKSNFFFCEDHFNLPEDMENYMKYHIMGSVKKIIMKPGCLPSKFDCQPDRKRSSSIPRSAYAKRQRKEILEQLLSSHTESEKKTSDTSILQTISTDFSGPSTSTAVQNIEMLKDQPKTADKNIQVYIGKKYRSKSVQTSSAVRDSYSSPIKTTTKNIAVSPFKYSNKIKI